MTPVVVVVVVVVVPPSTGVISPTKELAIRRSQSAGTLSSSGAPFFETTNHQSLDDKKL